MSPERVTLHFNADCVRLGAHAAEWQDAVNQVGGLLVDRGFARPGYAQRMIGVIERFGPYMVVAPGIALVHARPGDTTVRNGMAVITIPEGVAFGHAHNDPVEILIGITTTRPDVHLSVVAGIANALDDDTVAQVLLRAKTPEALAAELSARLAPALDLTEEGIGW